MPSNAFGAGRKDASLLGSSLGAMISIGSLQPSDRGALLVMNVIHIAAHFLRSQVLALDDARRRRNHGVALMILKSTLSVNENL